MFYGIKEKTAQGFSCSKTCLINRTLSITIWQAARPLLARGFVLNTILQGPVDFGPVRAEDLCFQHFSPALLLLPGSLLTPAHENWLLRLQEFWELVIKHNILKHGIM